MNATVRDYLRHTVDQRRRELIGPTAMPGRFGCAGCGTDRDNHTDGCQVCQQRHLRRARRRAA
jgi:hypothetical protein